EEPVREPLVVVELDREAVLALGVDRAAREVVPESERGVRRRAARVDRERARGVLAGLLEVGTLAFEVEVLADERSGEPGVGRGALRVGLGRGLQAAERDEQVLRLAAQEDLGAGADQRRGPDRVARGGRGGALRDLGEALLHRADRA